jgi:hypothetical protein
MVSFRSLPYRWFFCGLLLAALWCVPQSLQSVQAVGPTPKFFICPKGMNRDATVLTENYQVNLCSQGMQEISIAAMRQRRTKKQMNLPVTTKDDVIYEAKGRDTLYRFDFNKRTLTIQPNQGKAKTEKILASD